MRITLTRTGDKVFNWGTFGGLTQILSIPSTKQQLIEHPDRYKAALYQFKNGDTGMIEKLPIKTNTSIVCEDDFYLDTNITSFQPNENHPGVYIARGSGDLYLKATAVQAGSVNILIPINTFYAYYSNGQHTIISPFSKIAQYDGNYWATTGVEGLLNRLSNNPFETIASRPAVSDYNVTQAIGIWGSDKMHTEDEIYDLDLPPEMYYLSATVSKTPGFGTKLYTITVTPTKDMTLGEIYFMTRGVGATTYIDPSTYYVGTGSSSPRDGRLFPMSCLAHLFLDEEIELTAGQPFTISIEVGRVLA